MPDCMLYTSTRPVDIPITAKLPHDVMSTAFQGNNKKKNQQNKAPMKTRCFRCLSISEVLRRYTAYREYKTLTCSFRKPALNKLHLKKAGGEAPKMSK